MSFVLDAAPCPNWLSSMLLLTWRVGPSFPRDTARRVLKSASGTSGDAAITPTVESVRVLLAWLWALRRVTRRRAMSIAARGFWGTIRSNASLDNLTSPESRMARTVAKRGSPVRIAISPTSSPRPISPRTSSFPSSSLTETWKRPLMTINMLSPGSPCRRRISPPGTCTHSSSDARLRRSASSSALKMAVVAPSKPTSPSPTLVNCCCPLD